MKQRDGRSRGLNPDQEFEVLPLGQTHLHKNKFILNPKKTNNKKRISSERKEFICIILILSQIICNWPFLHFLLALRNE